MLILLVLRQPGALEEGKEKGEGSKQLGNLVKLGEGVGLGWGKRKAYSEGLQLMAEQIVSKNNFMHTIYIKLRANAGRWKKICENVRKFTVKQ